MATRKHENHKELEAELSRVSGHRLPRGLTMGRRPR